ncbi:RHS repeat-associated core domain-containing protein [Rhodoferax sp. AJA081-3]|uniref:RHS repeat-associated core domain-containing protein n=1 Tax=Rhodoferax sp. AJA081-3 TaxID=2752316 RepID=UPI0027398CC3|nr:RHS repeat-associated core domain-containing protein [Rhodoferax sp. AJA081-3]
MVQLALAVWTCMAPAVQAQSQPAPATGTRIAAPISADVAAQDLEQRLRDARELVRQLQSQGNTVSEAQRAAWTKQLRQQLNAAVSTTAALRSSLLATLSDTSASGATGATLARQSLQTFTERADALNRVGKAWLANPSAGSLADLAAFFTQYTQVGARLAATHNQLPWGSLRGKPRAPQKANAAMQTPPTQSLQSQSQGGGAPGMVQAQGMTQLAGLQFSTAPDPAQAPQAADVAETAYVTLTPVIRAKAAELGNNPVTITNWVRNTIAFAPNAGATQNAQTTLAALRGNATDIASLHIALLRAAGIPARYQTGTIELPSAQAQNWLGGLQHPEAALALLQQGGIAATGISTDGRITSIRLEHVWVNAYVNWSPSRGAKDGGANLSPKQHPNPNANLNAWTPLDAAFKPHAYGAGINLSEVVPLNGQSLFGRAKQGAICTPAAASGLSIAALTSGYTDFNTQALNQLAALGADVQVTQILGTAGISQRQYSMLAGTLPYATVVANTPVPDLAPAASWSLQLSLFNGAAPVFTASRPLADLQGQLLSLAFVPASSADATTLASLLRPVSGTGIDPATGLPTRIPAYLAQLKAQVSLNGQVVMEGGSFTLGQSLVLRSVLNGPDGAQLAADNTVVVGETHAWAVQGQALGASAPAAVSAGLMALRNQLQSNTLPSGPVQTAQLLSALAGTYQATLDAKARLYQSATGMVDVRLPSLVRASTRLEADTVLGVVTHVRPAGVGLHVDHQASASVSRSGTGAAPAYQQQSLERASASAHQLLDKVFGPTGSPAQSALSGLATAALQGQTLLRADSATLPSVLASLNANSNLRTAIQDAVASGQQALFSQNMVDMGGPLSPLPMEPLVLNDPLSGAASYTVTSHNAPLVQLTTQRAGLVGWLGLADAQASKVLLSPVLNTSLAQLNTLQALLGDWTGMRWQGFAGQTELIDGLFLSRVSEAAQTTNTCDWLISSLASQLSHGLPGTAQLNRPPAISSEPPTTATVGQAYSYAVQASDPDGDVLTYSLNGAPTGMTISAAGLIHWPRPVAGEFDLLVQVDDGRIAVQQPYVLSVTGSASGVQLSAAMDPSIADAGQLVKLTVHATAPAGAATPVTSATLNGVALSLNAQGVAQFTAPPTGTHSVLVKAQSGALVTSRELLLTVRDTTGAPPTAQATITSPLDDASLRGVVTIAGTASANRFAYYELLLRPVDAPNNAWTIIKRSLTPVQSASLGQLDTSLMANGLHQIVLRVVDVNGVETLAGITVDFVGNLKLGQFRLSFADVRAEAPGLPLMLTRTYDTAKRGVAGDFGYGWSASAQDISVRKNMSFGLNWQVSPQQFNLCLKPVGKRRVSITLPDGALYRFDAANSPECSFGQVPQPNIDFIPVPGPSGGSVAGRTSGGGQLKIISGTLVMAQGGRLVDADTGETWNPTDFELTTEEGFKYALRENVGILYVTDPYGNRVTYGANGYQHSGGLSVTLTRDPQGRITRATDPRGQTLVYTYNAQGDLASVTDRAGGVTTFAYATDPTQPHLLQSITDPRGVVVMANQFDEYGRLTASADALGQATTQEFEPSNNTQTVTDRRGNKTVYTFDADGNITQVVNPLGQTSTYTFDANGNETRTTNALGQTTNRTFDTNGKQTSETNPLGHMTRTTYGSVGTQWQRLNPLSSIDARGATTTYGYLPGQDKQPGATPNAITEPLGRSTSIGITPSTGNLHSLNIAGEALSYTYDTQGRRTQETNALGHETRYTFDANGNQTSRTVTKTINGAQQTLTTTSTYDAENRLVAETDPLGGTRSMVYNSAGKLTSQTNALGQKTSYTYDANARLIATQYPDGSSESTTFDAEGNETTKTDRAGRTTRMEFDALNRLVKTTYPDGTTETTTYDAAGRVTGTTDRKGQLSKMEYDAAGRQTASEDATGVRTTQTFDANGNRTSTTVAGRTTTFTYDELNRLTLTQYPDGSTHSTVYRPDNRKQSETDPRGMTTTYGYDTAGRLTSVTQSLSAGSTATTGYGYDETGAKTTQTDALNRTTTWSLDAGGRITSRKIQDGTTESNSYDLEGKRVSHTSFAGEQFTYQYDAQGQLTGMVVPQGNGANSTIPQASVIYTYTPSGQVQSQQEQGTTTLNGTQSYRYDANDRLIQSTSPLGQLNYTLDANGNPIERSVSNSTSDAGTATSTFDAAGRLASVTAPDGKQTRYSYDTAGRLVLTERDLNAQGAQAQVLRTHHRYDSADRTVAIAHVKQTGAAQTLMVGQALTRDAGGAVSRIEMYRAGFGLTPASFDAATGTFTGTVARTQNFEFDANARLTRENKIDAANPTLSLDTRYTYDAVGNRSGRTATSSAGTDSTTYTYDAADRLTQEQVTPAVGGTKTTTYTWDQNGNLASKTETGKATLYRFDPQNRLIDIRTGATQAAAQAASPSVSYAYDANGNRVKKTGPAGTTGYLVDANQTYAQVALETTGTNSTVYVWGNQLIRQTQAGAGNLFATANAANDVFPLQGHLNTSLGAIDANGNAVEQSLSDAFGQLDTPTGLKQNHLYTGEYWDQDSQLLYLRARWYDPKIGRFVSADPFEGKQRDPRSLNRYSYASSDPVQYTDPSGKFSISDVGAASVISGLSTVTASYATSTITVGLATRVALAMISGVVGAYQILDIATKAKIEECIESSRSGINKCRPGINMFILGDDTASVRDHIGDAMTSNFSPSILTRGPDQGRGWLEKYKGPGKPCSGGSSMDCDEYPFNASRQGGEANYPAKVSLRSVQPGENRRAGAHLGWFHEKCNISESGTTQYKVVAMKGIPRTGYICAH